MSTNNERMRILKMIEAGEIDPDEGARMLEDLSNGENAIEPEPNEQMQILNLIEEGKITPEEGAQKIIELENSPSAFSGSGGADTSHLPPSIDPESFAKWQPWWMFPTWVGIAVVILSGLWMNSAFQSSPDLSFWFYCSWAPMLLGILLIIIGGGSLSSRWLHIRIKQAPGESPGNIAISFPLPIRSSAWLLRNFGRFIPGLERTALDELILGLETQTKDTPFYIQIEDDEDGEQVEVFIG